MPRSSRSKSHKQSKHSSKDDAAAAAAAVREYSDMDEDVKVKERNSNGGKEDVASVRVSKEAVVSGEKRKLSKDVLNGDVSEEYTTSSKRRKERSDRWNGGGSEEKAEVVNVDSKELVKSRDLSKSKSSKRHDAVGATVVAVEKDESKTVSGSRGEKRRSERESGRKESHQYEENKEVKDKDRGNERESKVKDGKREAEALVKQAENHHSKRGRETSERPIEDDLRNPELEKELEKRIRRREGSNDRDQYQYDVKERNDRRLSSRSDRAKDVKHKDEGYRDKYRVEGDKESRHREDKYRDDGERASKNRDVKYRGESQKNHKHRADKYREDGERDRHREGKYREDGDRDSKGKDDKHNEDGDRGSRCRDEKYREGGDKDERNRDDKHKQDDDRDYRHKEEKHQEDVLRDYRHREGRPRDDTGRDRRLRDSKYRDVHTSRDHPSESETKSLRDDNSAAELYRRKTRNRDGSPIYDDRVVAKYKEDRDRRRDNDKDEPTDYRLRSTKDQYPESEKRSKGSAKVEAVSDRGRLNSRDMDSEITANHSLRKSSPSGKFYPARDHYRVSKLEETNYRDYVHEERTRHGVNPSRDFTSAPGKSDKISSRSQEKIIQKDDNDVGDISVERRRRSDVRSSPLVDKSPSSTSKERKHLHRPEARKSLDVEELGQMPVGSKDAKEYSDNDGKGSRDLAMEAHPDNAFPQIDGDNFSVSSPHSRSGHLSGNSKPLLPPPSFRTGSDSPSGFGLSEDDRGKSNNRHRRVGDPNMGRAQSNWKNMPNWPSPLGNGGFIPFPHVPPHMFHPAMQQFPPPMFGRPPVKVNHTGMPFNVPDVDRFSGHGRPLAWMNQVDESILPPMHGWEASNTVFSDESHIYGTLEWDHGRTQMSNRGWEPSADLWKSQDRGASMDMQSALQKDEHSAHRPSDEIWSGQSGQHIENEQNQQDLQVETMNTSRSGNASERNTPEAPKVTDSPHDDNTLISQIYLSKIDVSEDLTQPDLYDQCTSMLDLDPAALSDEYDCKILVLEEPVEANITDAASLFAAVNDSVFQRAMFLYKKQKEEFGAMYKVKAVRPISNDTKFFQPSDRTKGGLYVDDKPTEEAVERKDKVPIQNLDTNPVNDDIVTLSLTLTSNKTDIEVDHPVVKQEKEPEIAVDEKASTLEPSFALCKVEDVVASDQEVKDSNNSNNDDNDNKNECGDGCLSRVSDVSTTVQAVMPESIECGSVNLNRIHNHDDDDDSPESTH